MFESEQSQKNVLEFLRLESDCRELAARSHTPELRSHFLRMARAWAAQAAAEASLGAGGKFRQGKPRRT